VWNRRKWPDNDTRIVVVPEAVKVLDFRLNSRSVSGVFPGHKNVNGLEVAVRGEARPGLIHGAPKCNGIVVLVKEQTEFVVEEAPCAALVWVNEEGKTNVNHPCGDKWG
jgi:hypothetical protein